MGVSLSSRETTGRGSAVSGPLWQQLADGTFQQITDASGNLVAGVTAPAGSIGTDEIAAQAVTMPKLARGTNGQIIVANTGADSAYVSVSGDITITQTGVTAIGAGKVTSTMIANQAITTTKFVDAQAVTATADGTGTGAVTSPAGFRKFVTVTSGAATDQIALPGINAGTVGQEVWLTVVANGYELITPAASNNTINQVDADGTNQLDVAANTTVRCTQVSASGWIAETIAATTIAITAPDND
jgi:hypothetical protein